MDAGEKAMLWGPQAPPTIHIALCYEWQRGRFRQRGPWAEKKKKKKKKGSAHSHTAAIQGEVGGQWHLCLRRSRSTRSKRGMANPPVASVFRHSVNWQCLHRGRLTTVL